MLIIVSKSAAVSCDAVDADAHNQSSILSIVQYGHCKNIFDS